MDSSIARKNFLDESFNYIYLDHVHVPPGFTFCEYFK